MLQQNNVALARTYERNERTNAEPWLRTRDILTFRNARAHIRDFSSAGFGDGQ
jgi:hypothetical protein